MCDFRPLDPDRPALYRIRMQGRLSENWLAQFDHLTVAVASVADRPAITTLSGLVADQSALHGILSSIRDMGLPLLSVEWIGNP